MFVLIEKNSWWNKIFFFLLIWWYAVEKRLGTPALNNYLCERRNTTIVCWKLESKLLWYISWASQFSSGFICQLYLLVSISLYLSVSISHIPNLPKICLLFLVGCSVVAAQSWLNVHFLITFNYLFIIFNYLIVNPVILDFQKTSRSFVVNEIRNEFSQNLNWLVALLAVFPGRVH